MSQPPTRLRAVLAVFSLFAALPGRGVAQDRFEIEVYPYETAARGEWELETHLNYTQVGTTAFDGRVAPTRSEERRVGKSVDLGGRRINKKKNEKISIIERIKKTYSNHHNTQERDS